MARSKQIPEFEIEVDGEPYVWRLQRLPQWSSDAAEWRGMAIGVRHKEGQREAVLEFPPGQQPRYGAAQLKASQIAPALEQIAEELGDGGLPVGPGDADHQEIPRRLPVERGRQAGHDRPDGARGDKRLHDGHVFASDAVDRGAVGLLCLGALFLGTSGGRELVVAVVVVGPALTVLVAATAPSMRTTHWVALLTQLRTCGRLGSISA